MAKVKLKVNGEAEVEVDPDAFDRMAALVEPISDEQRGLIERDHAAHRAEAERAAEEHDR